MTRTARRTARPTLTARGINQQLPKRPVVSDSPSNENRAKDRRPSLTFRLEVWEGSRERGASELDKVAETSRPSARGPMRSRANQPADVATEVSLTSAARTTTLTSKSHVSVRLTAAHHLQRRGRLPLWNGHRGRGVVRCMRMLGGVTNQPCPLPRIRRAAEHVGSTRAESSAIPVANLSIGRLPSDS